MKHLGDITKINWFEVEPVDVVTGGSPCQDLSVAGKRAGLAGERSGLFMEQIKCVKELRQADVQRGRTGEFIRPRYMVWENVPGAFSSGNPKGADFAAVIEEIIKVAEPNADLRVRVPDRGWPKSGCYYAEDGSWSIAWRVHDAQFWGVPQRRKRIALVADFGGLSASEIQFERKGLSGHFEQSGTKRKGITETIEDCVDGNDSGRCGSECNSGGVQSGGAGINGDIEPTCIEMTSTKNTVVESGVCPTLTARMGTGGNQVNAVMTMQAFGNYKQSEVASACKQRDYKDATDLVVTGCYQNTGRGWWNEADVGATLRTPCGGDSVKANLVTSVDCWNGYENNELSGTIQAKENGGQSLNYINPVRCANTVRRLTPLECERLQGYPDGWTDIGEWVDSKGKKHKEADSPRYKALGNSIALPFWKWLLKRISAQYERDATLGSLFDGIGGFPYCWERVNGKGSARWASEIEEFPMAVTKLRFGED